MASSAPPPLKTLADGQRRPSSAPGPRLVSAAREPSRRNGPDRLLPQEQLAENVARERARFSRTGRPFSLVVFRLPPDSLSLRRIHRLALSALGRCRLCDDVGWFSSDAIAVLLPDINAVGAWRFAHAVSNAVHVHMPKLHCSVFSETGMEQTAPQSTEWRLLTAGDHARPEDLPSSPISLLNAKPLSRWRRAMDVVGTEFGLELVSPHQYAQAADHAAHNADHTAAIRDYRRALSYQPGQILWRLALARSLAAVGDHTAALREAEICLRLRPQLTAAATLIRKLSPEHVVQA